VGGETRHINSAFFTFQLEDQSIALPQLLLETQVEKERAANATARHYLWLDRMAIQFEERQVSLSSENAYELILKTVSQLLTNYSLSKWDTVATQPVSHLLYCCICNIAYVLFAHVCYHARHGLPVLLKTQSGRNS
jgi:hypothetical protein